MIDRLWQSLKYEWIYLNAFETGSKMRAGTSSVICGVVECRMLITDIQTT